MATLTLDRLWINRLDTGESVSAFSARDPEYGSAVDGDVRTYAGGRRRSVTSEGRRTSYGFGVRMVTLAVAQLLESWQGVAVQVRDHRGQMFTGTFFAVKRAGARDDVTLYDVAVTLEGVTVPEGV